MAERSVRTAVARPRASCSPNPVAKPTSKVFEKVDLAPLGLNWPAYRWVVRVLMAICLSQCVVVYVFCHDLPYMQAKIQLVEKTAVGFVILVCMSKTWHRKRFPHFLIWAFLLLLIYLHFSTLNAREIYNHHLAEEEILESEEEEAQEKLEQRFLLLQDNQKGQGEQLKKQEGEIQDVVQFLKTVATKAEEEGVRLKKISYSDIGLMIWSVFKNYESSTN